MNRNSGAIVAARRVNWIQVTRLASTFQRAWTSRSRLTVSMLAVEGQCCCSNHVHQGDVAHPFSEPLTNLLHKKSPHDGRPVDVAPHRDDAIAGPCTGDATATSSTSPSLHIDSSSGGSGAGIWDSAARCRLMHAPAGLH